MARLSPIALLLCAAIALLAVVMPAHAGLMLTPARINDGFTLTTFFSGYNFQYGPLAQGAQASGGICQRWFVYLNPNLQSANLRSNFGMWGNPVNGHHLRK